jgi:hypothetical protein
MLRTDPSAIDKRNAGMTIGFRDKAIAGVYLSLLTLASIHLYQNPIYDMDSLQHMGNALLMEEMNPVVVHRRVYSEVNLRIPQPSRNHLLGRAAGDPKDQVASRQQRATNPYRFAQFLPLFAIRPLYNQTLWLLSKTGLGLVRASIVISVASYFLLGILVMLWMSRYVSMPLSFAIASLSMISPPITALGRDMTSDALATLVAFSSLYLIFQRRLLTRDWLSYSHPSTFGQIM